MRIKLNSLWLLLFFLVPLAAFGQDSVLVIANQYPLGRLNSIIIADTLVSPSWKAGKRVYALQRGGIFPLDRQIQLNNNRRLAIRAAYDNEIAPLFGSTADPMIFGYDAPGTTGRPPGTFFIFGGTNNTIELKHVSISAFDENTPGEVDGVQGNIINAVAAAGDGNGRLIIDSCLLKSSNGNHIRADGRLQTIRVTNTIFGDMGNNATSNFGAGKGFDVRANRLDTLDVRNCTFVNSQDRIIRHYQSTAPILNLTFNNNTIVNAMAYHGLFSLGRVDSVGMATAGTQQIKNNLLVDPFALGDDSAAVRQVEFSDDNALEPLNGKPKMTWITSSWVASRVADWDIANNYYAISDSGRVMYNLALPYGPAYHNEGNPLTGNIKFRMGQLGQDTVTAFRRVGIKPVNVPDLMTRMIRWTFRPRSDGGIDKGKGGNFDPLYTKIADGNWTYDYNRKTIWYYTDTLNCNFSASISLPAGIGDPRWSQAGTFSNTLTVNATNGTATKYPDDATYATGSVVKLTAVPAAGYVFTGWTGSITSSTNPVVVTMDASKNITANFSTGTTYTLTTTASPSGSGAITRVEDLPVYAAGSTVTLTAVGSSGFSFTNWSGDATGSVNPLVVTMDANKNIVANFASDSFAVNVSSTLGTVTKNPDRAKYAAGTLVTLTTQPTDGNANRFSGWSGDPQVLGPYVNLSNPVTVAVVNTMNIVANYSAGASTQMNLTQPVIPGGTGNAITKAPNLGYYSPLGNAGVGDIVVLTAATSATPAIVPSGYEFKNWAHVVSSADTAGKTAATSPASFFMLNTRNVTAVYGLKKYTITNALIPAAGGDSVTRAPWNGTKTSGSYDTATVVTLSTIAKPGYKFIKWTCPTGGAKNGAGAAFDSLSNPTTVMMTKALAISAVFGLNQYTITTVMVPPAYGDSISLTPYGGIYDTLTSVSVRVYPKSGYVLDKWGGSLSGTTNPQVQLVNGNKIDTAYLKVTPNVNVDVPVVVGWNLVSVPDSQAVWTPATIFPGVYGAMFKFSGGSYVTANPLEKGLGYWAYFQSPVAPKTVTITGGIYSSPIAVPLAFGWNMVGSREVAVAKSALVTVPAGVIYGSMFQFSGGSYVPTTTIPAGAGVWIYVTSACTLYIP